MRERYEIAGKVYEHRPLVLGQFQQLIPVLTSISIDSGMQVTELLEVIGDKLPDVLAVALIPEGQPVKSAMSIQAMAERVEDIRWNILPEQAMEVVEDFFAVNRLSSISEKVTGMITTLGEYISGRLTVASNSSMRSTGSAVETSADEAQCCGTQAPLPPFNGSGSESLNEGMR